MVDDVNKLRQAAVDADDAEEGEEGVPGDERGAQVEGLPRGHHLLNGEDDGQVEGGKVEGPVPVAEGELLNVVADGNEGSLEGKGVLKARKAAQIRLPAVVVVDDVVRVVAMVRQLVPEKLVRVRVWILVKLHLRVCFLSWVCVCGDEDSGEQIGR